MNQSGYNQLTRTTLDAEETTRGFPQKMVFLKMLQISQENTSVGVSF